MTSVGATSGMGLSHRAQRLSPSPYMGPRGSHLSSTLEERWDPLRHNPPSWNFMVPQLTSLRTARTGGFLVPQDDPQPPILVVYGSFLRGGFKLCREKSCFAIDLNKAVPPWRRKSWRTSEKVKQHDEDAKIKRNLLQEHVQGTWQIMSELRH